MTEAQALESAAVTSISNHGFDPKKMETTPYQTPRITPHPVLRWSVVAVSHDPEKYLWHIKVCCFWMNYRNLIAVSWKY